MLSFLVTNIFSPLLADVLVRLIERYVKDIVFRGQIDTAVKLAKEAQTQDDIKEAAKAIHDAINVRE